MDIDNTVKTLGRIERQILYYYAIDGGEGQNIYRQKFINLFGINATVFERSSKMLHDKGFLKTAGWYPKYYVISVAYRVGVLSYLFRNDSIWEEKYLEVFNSSKTICNFFKVMRYALGGSAPSYTVRLTGMGEAFGVYYAEPWVARALEFVDDNSYTEFLDIAMYQSTIGDTLILRDQLEAICAAKGRGVIVQQAAADFKTAYLYLAYGEYTISSVPTTRQPKTIVTAAIRAMVNGEYEGALTLFTAAHKILNRTADSKQKNVFFNIFAQYYYVMTLVHLDNDAAYLKLTQYVNKVSSAPHVCQLPALLMARTYINRKRLPTDHSLQRLITLEANIEPLNDRHFGMLFDRYYGTGLYVGKLPTPSFAIMRYEMSEYLDLTDAQRAELREQFGPDPALTSIVFKQDWEVLIEDVMKTVNANSPGIATVQTEAPTARIVYVRTSADRFVVKHQTVLKSGGWSKFRNVAMDKFYDGSLEYMTDTDRTIARILKPLHYADGSHGLADRFLPYLVGSDRVMDLDGNPIKVEEEQPYIRVAKDPTRMGYKVESNVNLQALKRTTNGCVTMPTSHGSFSIIPIDESQRRIYERLLGAPYFPKEAEPHLRRFLTRLDEVINVKSPLIDQDSVRAIDGAAAIAVKVTPYGSAAYSVALYAKPLAEGSTYCVPGTGKPVVYDTVDADTVRVKRDLKAETSAYRDLLDVIDTDDAPAADGDYAFTLDIDRLLDLLDYSRQHPDQVHIEWPQGKAVKLCTPLGKGSWNVGIKAANGWFDLEGEVRLDDKTVIKMSQLLDMISQNRGRFVRLNDNDFVEIDKKLRRQLERLESIAVKNRNKLQISTLNAALIDDSVLNGEIQIAYDDKLTKMRQRILDSRNLEPKIPKKLKATLRPYQEEGYQWMSRLASWGAGACLADDMGLGKTVQTIAFLLDKASEGPALIVAPASVVPNWRNELERFAPWLHVEILNKADDRAATIRDMGKRGVLLTTYGLLNTEEESLSAKKWTTVCLDEAHTIKNRDTKMSQAAMKLDAKYRIALTGTPIQNHLGELWNLFRFINPGLLGPFDTFRQKYVIPITQDHDKDRTRALQRIIKPFMLRRTKAEVIDDLPDKTDIILPVELTDDELAMYEAMRKKAVETLEEAEKLDVNTLAEITKLRRAACAMSLVNDQWTGTNSKVQTFLELVRDFKGDGNRMLVFSQFTSFLEIVRKALDEAGEKYLYLDGSTTMKQREKLVEEFRQGDCPIFLISLKAGGLGLNLTEANYVVHLDPWWNPAIEQQATDRTYRIGQNRNVTVYHLVSKNTIEEKIRRLHQTKRDLSDSLLEGSDMAAKLTVKDVLELLNGE